MLRVNVRVTATFASQRLLSNAYCESLRAYRIRYANWSRRNAKYLTMRIMIYVIMSVSSTLLVLTVSVFIYVRLPISPISPTSLM